MQDDIDGRAIITLTFVGPVAFIFGAVFGVCLAMVAIAYDKRLRHRFVEQIRAMKAGWDDETLTAWQTSGQGAGIRRATLGDDKGSRI